jgi:hypothetical protein
MKTILMPRIVGTFFGLLLLCSCATKNSIPIQLPADVTLNKNAGRGGLIMVTLRLGSGDDLPFLIDTGAARTLLDKSFQPKLGNRLGTAGMSHFGDNYKSGIYAAPAIYLGGVPLMTDSNILTYDFKSQLKSRAGKQIRGILGMDCLKHYCIQLDFEAGKMRFLDPDHLDIKNLGKAFPITISTPGNRPFIYHVGLTSGSSTNCLIDTGCNYDGRVEKGALHGEAKGWVHLPECAWDGADYTNLTVQIGKHANMIGLRFLARHLVTLNFPKRTMYLKQTSVGPQAAVRVHPYAKIGENLVARVRAVQCFQFRPFLRLSLADETEHGFWENRPLALEIAGIH